MRAIGCFYHAVIGASNSSESDGKGSKKMVVFDRIEVKTRFFEERSCCKEAFEIGVSNVYRDEKAR